MVRKYPFESHSIILKLWTVCGLLANTKCMLRNWRAFFPLTVVWKGADCPWTVCRSWSSAAVISPSLLPGFSQPPGLISLKAGVRYGLEEVGQVEQGFEIASILILSHPNYLSSLTSWMYCAHLLFSLTRGQQAASNTYTFCRTKLRSGFW